jgi:hypothetical protein
VAQFSTYRDHYYVIIIKMSAIEDDLFLMLAVIAKRRKKKRRIGVPVAVFLHVVVVKYWHLFNSLHKGNVG